jgi:hypothetical protein
VSPISDSTVNAAQTFLGEVSCVDWLRHAGKASSEARAVDTVSEAFDSDKQVWKQHTYAVEKEALARLGDSAVDWIFDVTSAAIHQPLYDGVVAYFDTGKIREPSYDEAGVDAGLTSEMMDCVKRDISWAATEAAMSRPGFFSALLRHYRGGRWPCSWDGDYPAGRAVVL